MNKKLQKIITLTSSVATVLAISPATVFAEVTLKPTDPNYAQLGDVSTQGVVSFVINGVLVLAGLFAFIFLLWGGVQWIMAGGDKEGTEKARKRITSALVGLAIVFSAYAIAFLVKSVFGVDVLKFNIPSIVG